MSVEVLNLLVSVAVGVALVGVLAAAWVAVRVFKRNADRDERWAVASFFVNAAEQMLIDYDGPAKLDWVMSQLKAHFPKLDTTLIRAMVETAVREMKAARPQSCTNCCVGWSVVCKGRSLSRVRSDRPFAFREEGRAALAVPALSALVGVEATAQGCGRAGGLPLPAVRTRGPAGGASPDL